MNSKSFKKLLRGVCVFLLSLMFIFPTGMTAVYAAPEDTTRASVDSSGVQANAFSYSGQISADGRFVAFDSDANNLVAGDTNGHTDVFLRDLQLGTTVLVSLDSTGAQTNNGSGTPTVSSDGRYVAFESDATNLVAGDTNNLGDIFVKDMQTGTVSIATVDSSGLQANGVSSFASISGDGRYVVFNSEANNLVPNDVNGVEDIFVHDRQTGVTLWASTNGNASSWDPTISLDGRFVVFTSVATNLVANDTNGKRDIFVFAVQTGQITRASLDANGIEGDMDSVDASISGDGRYVSFSSASNNFMTGDTFGFPHAYVRDMQTGTISLVSFTNGFLMIGWSDATQMSADGRYVAFSFDDKGDSQPKRWIYIHDRVAGKTFTAVPSGDSDGFGNPILPSISGDGRFLAFASSSTTLVPGDTNGVRDIFVKEVSYPVEANPTIVSVLHGCPNGCGGPADQFVDFLVKFSETVTGVDMSDFALTTSGGIAGVTVSTVSGAGSDYIVRVDTGVGDGTIRLDIVDDDSIKDSALNSLGGAGIGNGSFTVGEVYTVDKSVASVLSVLRVDPNPTASGIVHYTVNFSESMNGVDISDFSLVATGTISGAAVTEVRGSGSAYMVTANTGAGDGTLRLDVLDDDSILDVSNVPLGGLGIGNGNFTLGEVYALDRITATVVSILRVDPNPTSAIAVHFSVTFSEPVSGVDGSDFLLTTSGLSGAAMTEILVSGNTYLVTVNTGSGNGTIRLDVVDDDSIIDASGIPLGGVGVGNGNFNTGEMYTINKIAYIAMTEKIRSTGAVDGWVLEANAGTGVGAYKNSNAATLTLGDDVFNRQYRSILSFPTYYLPDNAIVTRVILTIKAKGVTGTDPFTTHGNILVDIRYGPFGFFGPFGIKALQTSDFQADASMTSAAVIPNNPVGGWYWTTLDSAALKYINLTGITQMRLAFQLDTNDDSGDDTLLFYSGDYLEQQDRPHLLIEYSVPKW
jgi:Tol biopolymer transport system component